MARCWLRISRPIQVGISKQLIRKLTGRPLTPLHRHHPIHNYLCSAPTRPRSIIHPTHDLLGRFGILPVYDEFVRPFTTSAPGIIEDKGKRREDGEVQDDARHGPKEGLFQHGYKHFIKDLGRESRHQALFPIAPAYVRVSPSWEA